MKRMTVMLSMGLMLGSNVLAGGAGAPVKPAMTMTAKPCMTIAEIVSNDPQFSTLNTAIQAAGLTGMLMSGSYTVFAPTNAAFAKMPSDTLSNAAQRPRHPQVGAGVPRGSGQSQRQAGHEHEGGQDRQRCQHQDQHDGQQGHDQ